MNKIITFQNIEYYLADDVYAMEPESFTGCSKTSRLIAKNKKLSPNEHIYLKFIKSKNEWSLSSEEYKQAKLLITKDWVHSNLIQFKQEKNDEDLKIESMKAPPILELEENEKFVDTDGNTLDIEVRGTRNENNIFFKVKDIGEMFNIVNIANTLMNETGSFIKNIHYKCFKIINIKEGNRKSLFLTFKGLNKLAEASKSGLTSNTKYIIHKWLYQNFDKKNINNFLINKNIIKKNGYVYCVSSDNINYVKIGYWKGQINALKSRYKMYYGNNIQLDYVYTNDAYKLEQNCHNYFQQYNICN
jgi:hypothetical protein